MRAMIDARICRFALRAVIATAASLALRANGQSARYSSASFIMGQGGFVLNYRVLWTCDDSPGGTVSDPGQIDLVDAGGNLVGQIIVAAPNGAEQVSVSGAGTVSNENAVIHIFGAGGTPADGNASGTWTLPYLGPGTYTFRFWFSQSSLPRISLSTISTDAMDGGGGGPVGGPPAPPAQPPTASISPPQSATVFQQVAIAASAASGGNPLASVVLDVSPDNGATWTRVLSDSSPSSPSDSESATYAFAAAGTFVLRVTATDSAGLTGSAQATLAVGKANQPAVVITPPSSTITAGQSVSFAASGGATGNYTYGGAASGSGPTQTVAFPSPGTYAVTVFDSGNANYNPSPTASASVVVQAAFFTLSLSASAGGSVSGGGSYAPNSQASATAAAGPGFAFGGWTGDATGAAPVMSVLMNSNKSLTAHFIPMLAQTITFTAPGPVTTSTLPFALVATASSGLPVLFTLDSGPVALAGAVVAPTGSPGEVTVTATQPGNAAYLPAQPVVVTFAVGPPPPGVLLSDDSASTRRTDRTTRTTAFRCGPTN
jgi:uncharacterized repeat protein (TIGR02543 family)